MALHGCCGIIKYSVILVNLLFWFIGFSIVLLAIWMLTDPTFLISMTQNENNYFIGLYILLVVGGLMLTVAFLGCCGAFKESRCMLLSFFSCLLIVLVAELAAGAWAYHNSAKLDTYVRSAVKDAVQDEYSVLPTRTATLDSIQKYLHYLENDKISYGTDLLRAEVYCVHYNDLELSYWESSTSFHSYENAQPEYPENTALLKSLVDQLINCLEILHAAVFQCCGAEGPNDWQSSIYNNADRSSLVNIAISKLNILYKVPESCCHEGISVEECNTVRNIGVLTSIAKPVIYTSGCMEKLVNGIKQNIKLVYIVGAGIIGVEILALVFALLLCCAIRRSSNYKN